MKHDTLLHDNGDIASGAKYIPVLRDYIENLPKTSVTFNVTTIDDIEPRKVTDAQVEFAGSWRIDDYYGISEQRGRVFINPNAVHAKSYTDIVVKCRCGTVFSRSYDDGRNTLRDEHSHSEECKAWWRLEARAKMGKKQSELLEYLGRMGWRSSEIALRFGMKQNAIGQLAIRNNTSMTELRDEYRTLAGNTYAHLVRTKGVPAKEVADIYGHARTTLTRWAKKYSNYETKRGVNQFTRDEQGRYTWETQTRPAKRPEWLDARAD